MIDASHPSLRGFPGEYIALAYPCRHFPRPQSSSASRFTVAAAGVLLVRQVR